MKYVLNIIQPDGPPPPPERLDPIMRDVRAFMAELEAAGARVWNAGLAPASASTMVRAKPDGEVELADGPYAEGKEHIGGLVVVEAADLDAALRWAGKLSRAVTLPIEVRPVAHGG